MDLLARVGGLIDAENVRTCLPSADGLARFHEVFRGIDESIEECGRDLVAYVLTFQDQGLPVDSAVQAWAEEWSLV